MALTLGVVASVVLVVVAGWWAGSVTFTPTFPDIQPPRIVWEVRSTTPGSITQDVGAVLGITFRLRPDSFDPRADRLYVALERRVVTLDPATGGVGWWAPVPPPFATTGPLTVNYGDYVAGPADFATYVGTRNDGLLWYNDTADGPSQGALPADSVVGMAAFVSDMSEGRSPRDLILIGTQSGLVAVYASNHTEAWRAPLPGARLASLPLTGPMPVPLRSPAFSENGTLAVALVGPDVVALDTSTGAELWRFPSPSAAAAPVVFGAFGGEWVLAGSGDDGVILDLAGRLMDSIPVETGPVASHALVPPGVAVFASASGDIVAVQVTGSGTFGDVAWRARLAGAPSGPPFFLADRGAMIFGDATGRVTAYSTVSGLVQFRIRLCDAIAGPAAAGRVLVSLNPYVWAGCGDGSVFALDWRPTPVP